MSLKYEGANGLRLRLILATLMGRPVKISNIREDDQSPGLRDWEASFLRMLDKITNGSHIQINETGTVLRYKPGQLVGGSGLAHKCPTSRSVVYYLEALAILGLFCKDPLDIVLTGVTNDNNDAAIDSFRTATMPLLAHAGIKEHLSVEVIKRGLAASGGGQVRFRCPVVKSISPFDVIKCGKVKRIRGVAYTAQVSPQFAARMVDAVRQVFNDLLPDVWVYTDHAKGDKVATDRGYGLSLVAESITDTVMSADFAADIESSGPNALNEPERVGVAAAARLLQEIECGGVCDSTNQWLLIILAAAAEEHKPCTLRLGRLTPHTVQTLRHVRDFLGVSFNMSQNDDGTVMLNTVGAGLMNMARRTF
jgi:RNA 3'-terminal phosphate cyclase-like protein